MRTNIIINDSLMEEAKRLGGYKTKKDAVEAGLRLIIRLKKQEEMKKLQGKIHWEGKLEKMRLDNDSC